MSTYTMKQAESISRISAHSLRIWERRYNFMVPNRTESNIRFYSDAQLRKLINIGILLRNKYKISKVIKLDNNAISDLVIEILKNPDTDFQSEINAITLSMLELDENEFNNIYNLNVNRKGVLRTFLELIYPFLQHLGVLWTTNKAIPAQEHFITNLIRQKLIVAIDSLPIPKQNTKKLILFLPEYEEHEMGLLLANFIAKDLGWKTHYLGQNVPSDDIMDVIKSVKPDAMFSMLISPRTNTQDKSLEVIFEKKQIPWICSGKYDIIKKYTDDLIYMSTPQDLIKYLENFN